MYEANFIALLISHLILTTSYLNVINLGLESINGTRKHFSQTSSFLIGQDHFMGN
jgi:hypothetical protein